MANKDKSQGVTRYTEGTVQLCVYFPNDEVCCKNCKFLWDEKGIIKRCRCRLLDDAIVPYDGIEFSILPDCPIHFESEV